MYVSLKALSRWTLLLTGTTLYGCGISECKRRLGFGGEPAVVRTVSAGADLNIDAGTSKCSFNGYTWTCSPCADVLVPIGADATIDGNPSSQEWVSTDGSATFAEAKSLKTVATFGGPSPPQAGCISPTHAIELRLLDGKGVLHSDQLMVTVRCCGE